jgi:hypothetical protein
VLREVAGEHATYVNPNLPESIAEGIGRALAETAPPPSRPFTWERAAQLTAEIWRDVAERG